MAELEDVLTRYDYPLTPEQIATKPASPRDAAKLLVYNRTTQAISTDTFAHLDTYLPKGALIVFNDTKVVPARVTTLLATGGKVDLLYLRTTEQSIEALSPRRLPIGSVLTLKNKKALIVTNIDESVYTLAYSGHVGSFTHVLQDFGTTPIPPYLKQTTLSEATLRREYQTIFAKHAGSAAAPTASLHFTKRLLTKLRAKGFDTAFVTLHVGLGTFAPLTQEQLDMHALHHEWYSVPATTLKKIRAAKKAGRAIVAVGTTAARALESAFQNERVRLSGETTIFIEEGYQFKIVDALITNFHVPRSSLLMLVAALVGRTQLLALYAYAARTGFRFLSFGDGMLII